MALCHRSKLALYLNVFLSCVSFAIVLPSLWPYLHSLGASQSFLAYVVAVYSVGEALGAVAFGTLTARFSTRATLAAATLAGIAGSALYALAEVLPRAPGAVLLARLLQGCWSGGSQAVQQAYLADVLPRRRLTAVTVTLNAYACMGFVAGPAFAFACAALPRFRVGGGLSVTLLTAPGYFVLVSTGVCLALLVFVFDEQRDRAQQIDSFGEGDARRDEELPLLGKRAESVAFGTSPSTGLVICNLAFFIHFYGFALQETITT